MAHADFVHLRVHTAYSLLEGAIQIEPLVELCRCHAMPALAITDSGNMFGALEFALVCRKAGIQPIIGTLLNIAREGGESASHSRDGHREPADSLLLLAQNEAGYANLLKLSSKSFLDSDRVHAPQVSYADLARHSDGLIALTGGLTGPLGRRLADGHRAAAEAVLLELAQMFPGRLYLELQRHGLADEQRIEPVLLDLADSHDIPLVATNDVHFAGEDMYAAHDALICIAEGTYLSETDRRRLTPQHRFKTPEEMRLLFADIPDAVDNSLVVAQRCAYAPPERPPILPQYGTSAGRNEATELTAMAEAGLERRLEAHLFTFGMSAEARDEAARTYRERLAHELTVIIDMNYPGYFLIVADFIRFAKDSAIPVGPGRGSGAGSVVAWALGITDLDPLRFGLVFERFLNPDRVSMPDFDIDFCQEKREKVIRYVQQKYGHDRVAQIITFGTLQARAALRDVGRVLQMPYGQVDRLCKMVPYNPARPVTLGQAIASEARLQNARDEDENVARLLEIALKLEGLYRHASTHAAGVVIGDRPLDELVPLYRDPRSDMPVTQFSMKYAELSGLIKFDFLGLKTLSILDRARQLVRQRGIDIDLATLPLDDAKTYEMMARGDTVGVFQFESSGMRALLQEAKPDCFEDIIALVALFRPGPMENIPKYVACKHGREPREHLHDLIEPVVKDTYGVIIYQEQVMQIAQVFAGFSMGEADILRHAMGKKIKSEMESQRDRFVAGAMAKGVDRERAVYVFNLVDKFAGYGFNKAHSAGYGLLAYQTAWMKANHPVEFFAACMTLDLGNTDKLSIFKRELERVAITLLRPDINRSEAEFSVEDDSEGQPAIRYALSAIKNVGRQAMDTVVRERAANGPFGDLEALARRLDPRAVNKRQLENLVCAGALDTLNPNRAQTFATVESILRGAGVAAEERESHQENLFGDAAPASARAFAPAVTPWQKMEQLNHEFEAVGFYLSAHPLDPYARELKRLGVTPVADVTARFMTHGAGNGGGNGRPALLAGVVLDFDERTSAKGNRFARASLSDASGAFEVTLFSEQLVGARETLEPGRLAVIKVEARAEGDRLRMTAQSVQALEELVADLETGLSITLGSAAPLARLKDLLAGAGRGRAPVNLTLTLNDGQTEVDIAVAQSYAVTPPLRDEIAKLSGIREVRDF